MPMTINLGDTSIIDACSEDFAHGKRCSVTADPNRASRRRHR